MQQKDLWRGKCFSSAHLYRNINCIQCWIWRLIRNWIVYMNAMFMLKTAPTDHYKKVVSNTLLLAVVSIHKNTYVLVMGTTSKPFWYFIDIFRSYKWWNMLLANETFIPRPCRKKLWGKSATLQAWGSPPQWLRI